MHYFPAVLQKLIAELERLPGIGPKTAQRLALFISKLPDDDVKELTNSILQVKATIRRCSICFNLTDVDPCRICSDERRDKNLLCVAAEPQDIVAMESTGEYKGLYHVLGGLIDPLSGISADALTINQLIQRIKSEPPKEVILAISPTVEGDTTANYLAMLIKPLGAKVTRLAYGLAVGTHIDYADQITLIRALEGRREF